MICFTADIPRIYAALNVHTSLLVLQYMKKDFAKIFDSGAGKWKGIVNFIAFLFTKPGFAFFRKQVSKKLGNCSKQISYPKWYAAYYNAASIMQEYEQVYPALKIKPVINIVLCLRSARDKQMTEAIEAITRQLYPHWQLTVLASDGRRHVHDATTVLNDKRITMVKTANAADILACGKDEYVLITDAETLLAAHCLYEFVRSINNNPNAALLYADEDKLTSDGQYTDPYFKPGWSPHSLLTRNYIGETVLLSADLVAKLGARCAELENGIYDLLLCAAEMTNDIQRIPKILTHRYADTVLPDAAIAIGAVQDALQRRGTPGIVQAVANTVGVSIAYELLPAGRVSIIIPTKDQVDYLATLIDSIIQKTDYPDYEIIVLNNNSTSAAFFALMQQYSDQYPKLFRCIAASFPFNFSKLINKGVAASTGEYILMLNNDMAVINPGWLKEMVGYAQQPQTGAVGAKLLYEDDTIQHAGIVLGINGTSGHPFVHNAKDNAGYFGCLQLATNYAAVTAACLMCRREVYDRVGGMNEDLPVEYNDLDFCLRLFSEGYYNVYLPSVALYHYESATRGHPFQSKASYRQHRHDAGIFTSRWHALITNDPFYNPNLTLNATDFSLR